MNVTEWWNNLVWGLQAIAKWCFTGEVTLEMPHPPLTMTGPPIISLIFLFFLMWSLRWATRDGARRGKSKVAVGFFILYSGWPISLLFWRWLRPPLPMPLTPPPLPE